MKTLRLSTTCLFFIALFVLAMCAPAVAVTPQPAPAGNPNLNLMTNGTVNAIAQAMGGGVIIGGNFTTVQGTPRGNLAKINANGTLDTSWHVDTDGTVSSIVVDGSTGATYVGGYFVHVAGVQRFGLAKLAADGSLDAMWDPAPNNGDVYALALSGTSLYLGGSFATVGGQARNLLARVSTTGSGALDSWNANITGNSVEAITLDFITGGLYIAGSFAQVGGVSRSNLAKVSGGATATLDTSFNFPANSVVYAMALDVQITISGPIRTLYVGGRFTTLGGLSRHALGKIALDDNTVDTSFTPSVDGSVYAIQDISAEVSTEIFIAGDFQNITGSSGTTALRGIAVLNSGNGDPSTSGQISGDDAAYAIGYDSSTQTYYFGGGFRHINSATHYGLFAALSSLATMPSPAVDAPGIINSIITLNDGSQIVGGRFILTGSNPRLNLLKLTPSGFLDGSFTPPAPDDDVTKLCVSADGTTIFVGGRFQSMNLSFRRYLASVSATSGALNAFEPDPDGPITAMAVDDGSGALYVAGNFSHIDDGTAQVLIAKLSTTGHLTGGWNVNIRGAVSALAVDPAGYLYIGGLFTDQDTPAYTNLIKVATASGALVTSWKPAPDNNVSALTLSPDALLLYAGGSFHNIGGQGISAVAQLNAALGVIYPGWHPLATGDFVDAISADSVGRVFVGGNFNQVKIGSSQVPIQKLIKVNANNGLIDTSWTPQPDGVVNTMALDFASTPGVLTIGGDMRMLGATSRNGLAAIAVPPADRIFADGFN